MSVPLRLGALTTRRLAALVAGPLPVAAIVPVGSVEPHGPHLGLATDTSISEAAAIRAAALLDGQVVAVLAPAVPYGVTEYARAFTGAVSIPQAVLTAYLRAVVDGLLAAKIAHVCLVNNHLEPAHDAAVRASIDGIEAGRATVASPLTRRWARTLSDEFKSGACHAGRYETSIVLAHDPSLVDEAEREWLEDVPVSLSDQIRKGVTEFTAMGLTQGYAGSPRTATAAEGRDLIEKLATMVATEVREALGTG